MNWLCYSVRKLKPYFAILVLGIFASCNKSDHASQPLPADFKQPTVEPLTFSKPQHIDWDTIKPVQLHPTIKKININALPSAPYDTSGFKPIGQAMEEMPFDINKLASKSVDIDSLKSRALKFKSYILPPPRFVRNISLHLKNQQAEIYELEQQEFDGNEFYRTITDRYGFLWIAAGRGLYRYDGQSLLLYMGFQKQHPAFSILEDSQGRIWMNLADDGIAVLDYHNGILKKTGKAGGLVSNHILKLYADAQNRIWLTSYRPAAIDIIDPQRQTVRTLNAATGLSDTSVNKVVMDKDGRMWANTDKGVNIIDLKKNRISYLDKAHGLASDTTDAVFCDKEGRIWIGSNNAVNIVDLKKNTIARISGPFREVYNFLQDNQGSIWLGGYDRITIIDPEKRVSRRINIRAYYLQDMSLGRDGKIWLATITSLYLTDHHKAVVEHIGNVPTTTLAEDNKGLIWQGSAFKGLNIVDRKTKRFKTIDASRGLCNDSLQTIRYIQGKIFVCTNKGIDIIDPGKGLIVHPGIEHYLEDKTCLAVLIDKYKRLWVAGNDKSLNVYDPVSNTLKQLGKNQGILATINDMKTDSYGNIWLSSDNGVQVIDPGTWDVKNITNASGSVNGEGMLSPDNKGNMWIGTPNGLYVANLKKQTLTFFSIQQGLGNEKIISILAYGDRIYAGTPKGISAIDPPATNNAYWQVQSFGKSYGISKLSGTSISDMITHDGDYCWGDSGITVLDLSKRDQSVHPASIIGLNIMDQPRYFVDPAAFKINGNDVLIGPDNSKYTKGQLPVNTGYAFNSNMTWDAVEGPFNMPVNLTLPYDQNFVQFHYSSVNVSGHDTTLYRYRLIGADKNWSEITTTDFSRNYFKLPPGAYTFEVVARCADTQWSQPATFSFTITQPEWQSWWAYLLYALLIAGIIWCFVYYRENKLLEEKVQHRTQQLTHANATLNEQRDELTKTVDNLKTAQQQLIQSEKMASLGELTAGIAHEIQNPLNFVNNFSEVNMELIDEMQQEIDKGNFNEVKEIADTIKSNQEKIRSHGKRADFIVKGMLQHSRTTTGEPQPTNVNILADEFLKLSYHGLRAKDKSFNAEMVTHFDQHLPNINIVQQDIGRVLLNLFNNAFYAVQQKQKTAGPDFKPTVEVGTSAKNGHVEIRVKDNGKGIPEAIQDKIMQPFFTTKPTGEGTGLGLSISYDIVVKGHNGKLIVNSTEEVGTEFVVILPV